MESNLGFCGFTAYQKGFSKTITLSESQDSVVPDTLPDIAAILCTSGCVLIRSKDVADGHVRLEANIPARVCCAGEEGQRYCLDVNVPFFINAEDDGIRENSVCTAELTLKHLEARMLNPRKISVRAEIGAEVVCYSEASEMFSTAPQEASGLIHVLEQTAELTAIGCVTEKTFVLTDETELSPGFRDAEEIVAQNADILIQETRSVGSKLILKGTVRSDLIIRKDDGELEPLQFQTEFSQIVETQTETDSARFEVRMLTSGMYYELSGDDEQKTVSMELHLVAQIVVYTQQQIRFLADAYSNIYALEIRRQQKEIERCGREVFHRETITAVVETAGEINEVIACHALPVGCARDGEGIALQLLIRLCWKSGSSVGSAERTLSKRIALDPGDGEVRVCGISVLDVKASTDSGGAELRITLELRGFTVERSVLDCICAIDYDEEAPLEQDDKPTLVILYPRNSGDLWTLAKENCSTVEAICAANALDGDTWPSGRLILIPKTV